MAKQEQKPLDKILLFLTLALLGCGLLMLYSASTVESFKTFGNTTYYFLHQLGFGAGIGLVALFVCSRIDYHAWEKFIPVFVSAALLMLIAVKIPGIGFSAGGATRWIHIGPLFFQPAEIAKLVVILYVAGWVGRRGKHLGNFVYGLLPSLVIIGLFALLILWQPDVGTMIVLITSVLLMLFAGGVSITHLFWLLLSGAAGLFAIIKFEPYRAQRLTTFLNPAFDPLGIGYQINQALLAIGSGGWFGYGYGLSRQKHNYLPESFGDSIFAVTAEELGLARIAVILALFLAFGLRGLRVAARAPDTFGKLLALGIVTSVLVQAVINIGSIVGLLPLTGIPLPFFSYGSSALIVLLAEIGILLNISRQSSK